MCAVIGVFILSTAAAAAVGVEDKQRFNFGHAATIWSITTAATTKKRRNSHPLKKIDEYLGNTVD